MGASPASLGGRLVGERADLGQLRDEASDGAVGDPLDGTERAVELGQRVGGDESGDLGGEGLDLPVE
jgi:hypothetical protein